MAESFNPFAPFEELLESMAEPIVFVGEWTPKERAIYEDCRTNDREWVRDTLAESQEAFSSIGQGAIEEAYAEWLNARGGN